MARVETPSPRGQIRQAADHSLIEALLKRLGRMERLIRSIEEELADDELDDAQRVQNIGERVAGLMDGR